jgi:hypothetical protein
MEPVEERFFPSLKDPKGPGPSLDIIAVRFTETFGKIYKPTYQCRVRVIARSNNVKRDKHKMANFRPIRSLEAKHGFVFTINFITENCS